MTSDRTKMAGKPLPPGLSRAFLLATLLNTASANTEHLHKARRMARRAGRHCFSRASGTRARSMTANGPRTASCRSYAKCHAPAPARVLAPLAVSIILQA